MRFLVPLILIAVLLAGCVGPTPEEPASEAPAEPATPAEAPSTPVTPSEPASEPAPAPKEPVHVVPSKPAPECVLNKDCGMFAGCLDGACVNMDNVFIQTPDAAIESDIPSCSPGILVVRVNNKALKGRPLPISIIIKQGGEVIGSYDQGEWQEGSSIKDYSVPMTKEFTAFEDVDVNFRFNSFRDMCDSAPGCTIRDGEYYC